MQEQAQKILDSLNPAAFREDAAKFSAKLTFAERCSILALYVHGVNRRILSVAFKLNRRTVTHIYNENSPHYKNVREELHKLGKDEFIRRYLTEDVAARVRDATNSPEGQAALARPDAADQESDAGVRTASPKRNKVEGIHVVSSPNCTYSHRVEIAWVDSHLGPGWYFKDMDGPMPDEWLNDGPASILSSQAALRAAEQNIQDRIA